MQSSETCGDLSVENLVERLEDSSDRESEVWVDVPVVPDVTDVPVSSSPVVTEFCDGFSCCSGPFLSKKSSLFAQLRRKR